MSQSHKLRGVLLLLLGMLLFACMDTTTKYLSAHYDVPLIVAARYLGNLLLMGALLGFTHRRQMTETHRTRLVIVRALCLASASLLVGLALQRMPVAETTAIGFLAPIAMVIAAGPVLGEKIGATGWASALLGFAGVLIIVRPGSGLETVGVLCALTAVFANTGYALLSRILARTERTIALLFYTALVGAILFSLALPWFLHGVRPSAFEALLFFSLGVYGGLGHFLFTTAYRHAPASLLAPMNYVQLLWAGLLGWLIFGHVPDRTSLIGMAVVAVSGVMVALKTRKPPEKRMV